MSHPLVSILTPFKNTAEFLPECLDSIINQSYTNWELIIIDDDSTDTSFDIVSDYSKNDSRIQLYKNSGKGIIEALRLAFKLSKGEYITRMDSDDIMYPEKTEVLLKNLLSHGRQHIAIGLVKYFNNYGLKDGYKSYESWLNTLTGSGNNYSAIYKECVIPSPCWMLHRDDLINCGAFDPNRYPEDYDLAFRCYEQNYNCIPCETKLHYWRDYDYRTSRTNANYSENHFIDLKLHYFLKLNHNKTRPLVVWGAGTKGKYIAKALLKENIKFIWICDNPKKIGKYIYDVMLHDFSYLKKLHYPQSIISVANKRAQNDIKDFLKTHNMISMEDYFFFC